MAYATLATVYIYYYYIFKVKIITDISLILPGILCVGTQ